MKKARKAGLGFMALALVAGFGLFGYAENAKQAPNMPGRAGLHENLKFYGMVPCRISASTTAVLCKAGEGFLDAVCPSGGTLGKYSLALDSGVAGTRSVTNSDTLVLTPMVYTHIDTGSRGAFNGCWELKEPARFVNGLVGVQSDAGHSTLLYWHRSDGENP